MKSAWQTTTLGEVCGFVRGPFGGSLKKSIFVEDGFAVYEQQHAIYNQFEDVRYFIDNAKFKEMKRFEVRPNDLIMSCSGTMGKVAIVPGSIRPGIINQALLKLTPSNAVSSEFLKYWMESTNFQESLKEQSGGAAIQNVASVSILKEIRLLLPPFSEQQRIVSILNEAFDGIATAKANAEKNLQNTRDLFESYLQAVFIQKGKGWLEKIIGDVCKLFQGLAINKKTKHLLVPKSSLPLLRIKDLRDNTEEQFVVENGYPPNALVHEDDILYTRTGNSLGLVFTGRKGILHNNSFKILPGPLLRKEYLFWWLQMKAFKERIYYLASKAAQPDISHSIFKEQPILIPPLQEQWAIAEQVNSLSMEVKNLEAIYNRKLVALDELKKSLLNQAFNGQL